MDKKNNKEITNKELLESINRSFSRIEDRIGGDVSGLKKDMTDLKKDMDEVKKDVTDLKKEVGEVKENLKATRRDISEVGDRFVPRYEFDNLLIRFNKLEQKFKQKIK